MNDAIQFHSRVDGDGFLSVRVDLGSSEAKKDVLVTIESMPAATSPPPDDSSIAWDDFVDQCYGSCAGLDLGRPIEGKFESRESIE